MATELKRHLQCIPMSRRSYMCLPDREREGKTSVVIMSLVINQLQELTKRMGHHVVPASLPPLPNQPDRFTQSTEAPTTFANPSQEVTLIIPKWRVRCSLSSHRTGSHRAGDFDPMVPRNRSSMLQPIAPRLCNAIGTERLDTISILFMM